MVLMLPSIASQAGFIVLKQSERLSAASVYFNSSNNNTLTVSLTSENSHDTYTDTGEVLCPSPAGHVQRETFNGRSNGFCCSSTDSLYDTCDGCSLCD